MKKQTQTQHAIENQAQWYAHKLARVKMWREVRECVGMGLATFFGFAAIAGAVIGIASLIVTAVETVDRSKKVTGLEAELAQVKSQCAGLELRSTSHSVRLSQLENSKPPIYEYHYTPQPVKEYGSYMWTNYWNDNVIRMTNTYITNSIILR